jgi:hypothetical protein
MDRRATSHRISSSLDSWLPDAVRESSAYEAGTYLLRQAREHRRISSAAHHEVSERLDTFDRRWGPYKDDPESDGSPVFLLSVGWRSGSTLLQRLIDTSGDILLWGEPYNRSDILRHTMDQYLPLDDAYPAEGHLVRGNDVGALSERWIASIVPDPTQLRAAHRFMFLRLYQTTATELGRNRWGLKEVRYGFEEARFLQWLFPSAKFVIIHRNPYDTYQSYRGRYSAPWYKHYPTAPIIGPRSFGEHWRRLAEGLVLPSGRSLDSLVVRYEDLIECGEPVDDDVVSRLEEFLGIEVDRSTLGVRIRGLGHPPRRCSTQELRALGRYVEPTASVLGYHAPVY